MKYKRIRDLREDKDLTQTEIAKILNITQRTYSRYENDERQIPTEILSSLADFHHTSVDYLIGLTNGNLIRSPNHIVHKFKKSTSAKPARILTFKYKNPHLLSQMGVLIDKF